MGKFNEMEVLVRAWGFVPVLEEIELFHHNDDSHLYDVYYMTKNRGFICISPQTDKLYIYALNTPLKRIISENKHEILKYRLGANYGDAVCTVGDVFMWDGGYLDRLNLK